VHQQFVARLVRVGEGGLGVVGQAVLRCWKMGAPISPALLPGSPRSSSRVARVVQPSSGLEYSPMRYWRPAVGVAPHLDGAVELALLVEELAEQFGTVLLPSSAALR
jgi:hypothetical protein